MGDAVGDVDRPALDGGERFSGRHGSPSVSWWALPWVVQWAT